jgi:hypothetical protein
LAAHAAGTAPVIELNDPDKLEISLRRIGGGTNPLLVVDNVLANPHEIRSYALGVQWLPPVRNQSYYAGYTSTCTLRGMDAVGTWAADHLWKGGYGLEPREPSATRPETEAFFALFAPEGRFRYSVVHTDAHAGLTMLVYLTPGEEDNSGTAFWRHVATGLESGCSAPGDAFGIMLKLDRLLKTELAETARAAFKHAPEKTYSGWVLDVTRQASSTPPFPSGDHGPWQKIDAVGARYNRLVAFPAWQFHSALMKRPEVATTLDSARLTLNAYVKHPAFCSSSSQPVGPMSGLSR